MRRELLRRDSASSSDSPSSGSSSPFSVARLFVSRVAHQFGQRAQKPSPREPSPVAGSSSPCMEDALPDMQRALRHWRRRKRDDAISEESTARALGAAIDNMCAWHRGSACDPPPLVRSGSVRCSKECANTPASPESTSPLSRIQRSSSTEESSGSRSSSGSSATTTPRTPMDGGDDAAPPRLAMRCSLCDQRVERFALPLRKVQLQEYACHTRRDGDAGGTPGGGIVTYKTWCDALSIEGECLVLFIYR